MQKVAKIRKNLKNKVCALMAILALLLLNAQPLTARADPLTWLALGATDAAGATIAPEVAIPVAIAGVIFGMKFSSTDEVKQFVSGVVNFYETAYGSSGPTALQLVKLVAGKTYQLSALGVNVIRSYIAHVKTDAAAGIPEFGTVVNPWGSTQSFTTDSIPYFVDDSKLFQSDFTATVTVNFTFANHDSSSYSYLNVVPLIIPGVVSASNYPSGMITSDLIHAANVNGDGDITYTVTSIMGSSVTVNWALNQSIGNYSKTGTYVMPLANWHFTYPCHLSLSLTSGTDATRPITSSEVTSYSSAVSVGDVTGVSEGADSLPVSANPAIPIDDSNTIGVDTSATTSASDVVGATSETISGTIPISTAPTPTAPLPTDPPNLNLPQTLVTKFPFCLPWDLYNAIAGLAATPQAPQWIMHFGSVSQVIDLSQFNGIAAVARWGESLLFLLGLIVLTQKVIRH